MMKPGDIVTVDFPGVRGVKRRPVVIVSTEDYHSHRPDIIVGVLTTNIARATAPSDYLLQDYKTTGLRRRSAFRVFLATLPASSARKIGRCSDRDWQAIQECLKFALEVT